MYLGIMTGILPIWEFEIAVNQIGGNSACDDLLRKYINNSLEPVQSKGFNFWPTVIRKVCKTIGLQWRVHWWVVRDDLVMVVLPFWSIDISIHSPIAETFMTKLWPLERKLWENQPIPTTSYGYPLLTNLCHAARQGFWSSFVEVSKNWL